MSEGREIDDSGSYDPHSAGPEASAQDGDLQKTRGDGHYTRTWSAEEIAGASVDAAGGVADPLREAESAITKLLLNAAEQQGPLDFLFIGDEEEDISAAEPEFDDEVRHRFELTETVSVDKRSLELAAFDRQLQRPVVVHFMHPALAEDEVQRERFLRCARTSALLSHPNIRPVFDAGICQAGLPFMTLRVMDAERLADLLDMAREGAVPEYIAGWRKRCDIMMRIADGITAAHADGIVHQNLKPDCIWVGDRGEVTVDAWWSAVLPEDRQTDHVRIEGTPAYMAPEQARGESVDVRSDVYALGAIWYELLTLRLPCWSDDPDSLMQLKASGAWRPLDAEEHEQVPSALLAVCKRAMQADPDQRFPHAGAFADALRAAWDERRQGPSVASGSTSLGIPGLLLSLLLGFALGVLISVMLLG